MRRPARETLTMEILSNILTDAGHWSISVMCAVFGIVAAALQTERKRSSALTLIGCGMIAGAYLIGRGGG